MLNPVASTAKSNLLSALTSASPQTGKGGETADFEALLQGSEQTGLVTQTSDALADLKLTPSPLNLPTGNGGKGTGKILPEAETATLVTESPAQADEASEGRGAISEMPIGIIFAEPIRLPAPVASETPRFDAITDDGRKGGATTTASPASTVSPGVARQGGLVFTAGTPAPSEPAAPASQLPVAKSDTAVSALLPGAIQSLAGDGSTTAKPVQRPDKAQPASSASIDARGMAAAAEKTAAPSASASFIARISPAPDAQDRPTPGSSRVIATAAASDTSPMPAAAIAPADGAKAETATDASGSKIAPSPEGERGQSQAGERVIRASRGSTEEAAMPARAATTATATPAVHEPATATPASPTQTVIGTTAPTSSAAPVSTSFAGPAGLSVEQPQDIGTLVDRLVEAREAAMPNVVRAAVSHGQFGNIAMQFQSDDARLSVTMTSSDPDFAPAVQAAAAQAAASADQSSSQSRSDAHSRQDQQQQTQQQGGASASTGGQSQSQAESRAGADRDSGRTGRPARTETGQNDPDRPQSRKQSPGQGGIYA